MVYNTQNYWVFGLFPSSGILENTKQKTRRFGNWICFCLQVRGEDSYSVGPLRLALPKGLITMHKNRNINFKNPH
jgi:hypothetical protein